MASLFAITTVTDTIPLASNRQGQVAFTVSNTTDRSFRSHVRLWSQPIAANAWVKLVGDAERDIAAGESQQYLVQIAVPADAAAGEYLLRLDMVDVSDPDESLSVGPTVKFTVPAPVVVKPKPFPWWIIAAVVLVVLLIVGGIYGIARAGQKPTPTPIVGITPTPTLATPLPTVTTGTWQGQARSRIGILSDANLFINQVKGVNFMGTFTERSSILLSSVSEVTIVGHVVGFNPAGSTSITFTDPTRIEGTGIVLNAEYDATIAGTNMNGYWFEPGAATESGSFQMTQVRAAFAPVQPAPASRKTSPFVGDFVADREIGKGDCLCAGL